MFRSCRPGQLDVIRVDADSRRTSIRSSLGVGHVPTEVIHEPGLRNLAVGRAGRKRPARSGRARNPAKENSDVHARV